MLANQLCCALLASTFWPSTAWLCRLHSLRYVQARPCGVVSWWGGLMNAGLRVPPLHCCYLGPYDLPLDYAPCHTHWEVIAKGNATGIWSCFIPVKMASTLQPLNVCCCGSLQGAVKAGIPGQGEERGAGPCGVDPCIWQDRERVVEGNARQHGVLPSNVSAPTI